MFAGKKVNMLKSLHKIESILVLLCVFTAYTVNSYAEVVRIDELKGLQRNPQADRIEDGAHDRFDNIYVNYGNLQVVKGRDRLNSTAHSDTTVNALCYYENQTGSTKKIIIAESDELVSYDVDGTNRTQIAGPALTNEKWDCVQIADTLYITSSTNGLYKWTGSGTAALITGVSAPSSVTFSASSAVGGLTSGLPAVVTHKIGSDTGRYIWSGGTCVQGSSHVIDPDESGTNCGSLSGNFNKACATTSTYQYKITKFSTTTGLESEPSAATSATLTGSNTVSVTGRDCYIAYTNSSCTTGGDQRCTDTVITISGEQSSTTGTLASAPAAPFNSYRIYSTVAGGSDFFLLGQQITGTYTHGKPDVTLGSPLDTTLDTIDPPSFRYIEEYKGAIFVAEGDTIKYTHIPVGLETDADKYWLDTDEIKVTGNITGLIKASDSLIIFTTKSVYQLIGFGVTSFELIPIITGVGAINDESIEIDTNGDIIFFSGSNGVYKLTIGQQPTNDTQGEIVPRSAAKLVKLSSPALNDVFTGEDSQITLSPADYTNSHAYYDSDNDLYTFYIGNRALMLDQTTGAWTHIPATRMSASMYRKSPNAAGVGVLVDNLGFFFNNWTGYENGIESGTVTGTPTSSTSNTLTCSGCTFNTTNDGLKGLWIFIDNENDEYHQISSNTGTQITISDTWTTNPITTDNFYIAYIIPHWRTKQYSFTKPPDESKVSILYINHNKPASTQNLEVYASKDKSTTSVYVDTVDLTEKFIDVFNTVLRSSWVQWEFRSFIYNTSNSIDPPIDVVSYATDVEAERSVNRNG